MRVGLIDADMTSWRNLHLMKRAAWHKAQGDEVVFPYDGAQRVDKVVISTVFTRNRISRAKEYRKGKNRPSTVDEWLRLLTGIDWRLDEPWNDVPLWGNMEVRLVADLKGFTLGKNHRPEASDKEHPVPKDFNLYAPLYDIVLRKWNIEVGGTGWNIHSKAPEEIEAMDPDYTLYDAIHGPANYGQGFVTRGCPRGCHLCVVPEMSGSVVKQVASLDDIRNGDHKFIKLMDDNFWATSPDNAWRYQMKEAIEKGYDLSFTQGLDIRFVDEERANLLYRVRFWNEGRTARQVTFAFDSPKIEKQYRRGFNLLLKAGIKPSQIASFVLMGFESVPQDDDRRLRVLRELGADPYAMVYEPIHGEPIPEAYLPKYDPDKPEVEIQPSILVDYYYNERPQWNIDGSPRLDASGEQVKLPPLLTTKLAIEELCRRHWKRCKHMQRWSNHKAIWKSVLDFEDYEPWQKEQRRWAEMDNQQHLFAV